MPLQRGMRSAHPADELAVGPPAVEAGTNVALVDLGGSHLIGSRPPGPCRTCARNCYNYYDEPATAGPPSVDANLGSCRTCLGPPINRAPRHGTTSSSGAWTCTSSGGTSTCVTLRISPCSVTWRRLSSTRLMPTASAWGRWSAAYASSGSTSWRRFVGGGKRIRRIVRIASPRWNRRPHREDQAITLPHGCLPHRRAAGPPLAVRRPRQLGGTWLTPRRLIPRRLHSRVHRHRRRALRVRRHELSVRGSETRLGSRLPQPRPLLKPRMPQPSPQLKPRQRTRRRRAGSRTGRLGCRVRPCGS